MSRSKQRMLKQCGGLVCFVLPLLTFCFILSADFVMWDDDRAIIDNPDITIPGAFPGDPVRWRWRSNRLGLELQPWIQRKILFSIVGRHRLYASRSERQERFEVTLGSASGQARIASDGRMESVVLWYRFRRLLSFPRQFSEFDRHVLRTTVV